MGWCRYIEGAVGNVGCGSLDPSPFSPGLSQVSGFRGEWLKDGRVTRRISRVWRTLQPGNTNYY
jgi:hypothetical protein